MPATANYAAGIETNQTQLSYAVEINWGVLPVVQFQEIRYTSSGLRGSKTRQRPAEIRVGRDSSAAITTQETAGGQISFALSYGTYDDLLASVFGRDWTAGLAISGAAGDISAVASGNQVTSTTTGKFTNVQVGQWIRLLGFTTPANNALLYVATKADNQTLTVTGATLVNETPALALAQIRGSHLSNGAQFQSLYFQQRLASNLWMRYPGSYPTTFTLSGGSGQFLNGSFTLASQNERTATSNASTGAILAAPAGRVHDSVGGFKGVYLDGVPFPAAVTTFSITVSNEGASPQYVMGSAAAAGMQPGTLLATGNVEIYFKDFDLHQRFINETLGSISFVTADAAGNAYIITLPSATVMNPDRTISGPGANIMARYDLEGGPHPTLGSSVTIDRLPAV